MKATHTPACGYSEDTEILTRGGWVRFGQLTYMDEVATRSPDGRFEWQHPQRIDVRPHEGDLLHFRSQVFNLMVTPAHPLLVQRRGKPDRMVSVVPEFRNAAWFGEALGRGKNWRIPMTSHWPGDTPEYVLIPAAERARGRHHPAPELHIPAVTWARFLGWFVSEGFVLSSPHQRNVVGIAQERELHRPHIRETLAAMGITYYERRSDFQFSHGPLAELLRQIAYTCGEHRAWNKRLPDEVKGWAPALLAPMVEAMILGDGHIEKTGLRRYITTSAALADDLVEVLQKMGAQGWHEEIHSTGGGSIGARKIAARRLQYRVTERPGLGNAVPAPVAVPSAGPVHGISTANRVIYVRRDGRTAWCGSD